MGLSLLTQAIAKPEGKTCLKDDCLISAVLQGAIILVYSKENWKKKVKDEKRVWRACHVGQRHFIFISWLYLVLNN